MDISSAVKKGDIRLEPVTEKVRELYSELYQAARRLYSSKPAEGAHPIKAVEELINKVINALETDAKNLTKLSLDDYPRVEDYFYYHITNVTILSIELANGLGYERKELLEIGTAAFIHDIGLIKYENVIETSKALTKMEYDAIKNHPNAGLEALNKLGSAVTPAMRDVVCQEHERLDGSGYPNGLKGSQITEQAQVVGLIDVYEALTHQRPYMNKHKIEAIKSILGMKSAFDPRLVKALIERVGVFPVGVFVRLNTKEIGMVVDNNTKLPFRPVVSIVYDSEGRQLKEPKLVNLADNSVIFIEECTETPPPRK
jgi:HD-GYP domain-containing protein (c-di-GMP phosphodiesterase class II)